MLAVSSRGCFQPTPDPIDHAVLLPLQVCPPPAQVAQFANRWRRDEASFQQSILHQFRDAFAVFAIGLAARQGMHMFGFIRVKTKFASHCSSTFHTGI
jgi:hypothetical protein